MCSSRLVLLGGGCLRLLGGSCMLLLGGGHLLLLAATLVLWGERDLGLGSLLLLLFRLQLRTAAASVCSST